jgi:hypothetical protein
MRLAAQIAFRNPEKSPTLKDAVLRGRQTRVIFPPHHELPGCD